MNQIPTTIRRGAWIPLALAGCLWALPNLRAQNVAQPPASGSTGTSGQQEDIVELSPFTVDASNDIGYYAENTLAGSRLNTNVGDLASSITVVTKQQLEDTGSLDINDVFLYEANTEGAATYTPYYLNRGSIRDAIGGYSGDDGEPYGIATANRVRGLGAADTSQNNYPTISRIGFDSYNTNTVEINRGPNSLLFGTGSPSGIVNQSTSSAVLGQQHTTVSGRFGSYGAWRASLGTNIPLGDKVAVYLAALYDKRAFQRKPSTDVYRRQYAAVTYQPFERTKLTASFEHYDNFNHRPNFGLPLDYVTPWIEAGRPGWNPVTQMVTLMDTDQTFGPYLTSSADPRWNGEDNTGNGALSNTTSNIFVPGITFETHRRMFVDRGQIIGFTPGSTTDGGGSDVPANADRTLEDWVLASGRLTASRGFVAPLPPPETGATEWGNWYDTTVTDKSIYDWEKYNIQGANYGTQDAKSYNIEFQQQLLPNLNFSAGWFRQELEEWTHYGLGQANQSVRVFVDTNTHNLDGTPNAYFGTPYVYDYQSDTFYRPEKNDNLRAMLAWEFDFTKNDGWSRFLGRHRLLGLATRQKAWKNNLRYRLSLDGGDPRFLPGAASQVDGVFSWGGNSASFQRYYYLGQNDGGQVRAGVDLLGDPGYGGPDSAFLRFYDWEEREWSVSQMSMHPNLFYAGGNYGVTKKQIDSTSIAWQGYLWDERIIPTIGVRRDSLDIRAYEDTTSREEEYVNGYPVLGLWNNLGEPFDISGTTRTTGVVVKPFKGWDSIEASANNGDFLSGLLRGLSLHYNESDNFNAPTTIQYDYFGNRLPKPSGKGKDYGFGVSMFNNKLNLRVNWFKSTNKNAPANAAGTAIGRTNRIDTSSSEAWARKVVRIRHGEDPEGEFFDNNEIFPLTQQMEDEIKDLRGGLSVEWPNDVGGTIQGTESNESKGMEFQLIYNPLRNWNIKLTAGKQESFYSDAVGELQKWIAVRKPFWESLAAPDLPDEYTLFNGNKLYVGEFWHGYGYGGDSSSDANGPRRTVADFYASAVEPQIYQVTSLQGTAAPNLRKWSFKAITNYAFQSGPLRGFAIGGSYRWQDKAVAGYYGLLDPSTYSHPSPDRSLVVFPDLNRPITTPSLSSIDLWASYTTRLFEDKVRMKVQLNVRDAFESGGIQAVLFQPDGTPAQYRIKEPRQWFVTTTFDF